MRAKLSPQVLSRSWKRAICPLSTNSYRVALWEEIMSRIARLGAFLFMSLVIFAIAIFLIGQHQFLFSSKIRLSSSFDNVAGLIDGAEVRVGGVNVGTVDHI